MSLVTNERIKLTAGLLNTVAGFSLTAGGIGPLIAWSFGLSAASPLHPLVLALIIAIWFVVGLGFHWGARYLLGTLRS
jgi:hypothetical protein